MRESNFPCLAVCTVLIADELCGQSLFFYLLLPETKKKPLEEMNFLFSNAPWIVPGSDPAKYNANLALDLERRANELREKGEVAGGHEEQEHVFRYTI